MEARIEKAVLAHAVYLFKVDEYNRVIHLGFAADEQQCLKSDTHTDRGFSGQPYAAQADRTYSLDTKYQEYSSTGVGDYRPSSFIPVNPDGTRAFDPIFKDFVRITDKSELEARENRLYGRKNPHFKHADEAWNLTLIDPVTQVEVVLHYDFFRRYDAVQRSATVVNAGQASISVEKVMSATLDIPARGAMDYIHFHGHHANERRVERARAPHASLVLSSTRCMSSHHENPSLILCDAEANEDRGECWLFSFLWSGDFAIECYGEPQGGYRVNVGLNPVTFRTPLAAGESFTTPCAILSYSPTGLTDLSLAANRLISDHLVMRSPWTPVLLNSWEGVMMNFDQDKLVAMAKGAKAMGCDLFVVDDGWFGHRDDDHSSLGDWYYDPAKLPQGLEGLGRAIRQVGVDLGIWVEPEMVSEDSDLFRKHPDWAIGIPGRQPNISRSQRVLDMTNPQVRDYLFERLDATIRESGVRYLKWDFNRAPCDLYASDPARTSRFSYDFVLGTYDLLSRVGDSHPEVLLETCAGGGGRFDLGMLYFTPQIWCSDNTDAFQRAKIQNGTSYVYPPFTMGAHISKSPNPGTGVRSTLMQRFVTALVGTYGYELDPAELSEAEVAECHRLSDEFRRLTPLIRQADFIRLSDPETDCLYAYEFLTRDQNKLLVGASVLKPGFDNRVKLKRLDPAAVYTWGDQTFTGAQLMEEGLPLVGLNQAGAAAYAVLERKA